MSLEDKARLSVFTALQFIRGVDYRARAADLARALQDHLVDTGDVEGPAPQMSADEADAEGRASALHAFENNLLPFAAALAQKDLLLFSAPADAPFMIGDSPVTLANASDFGLYGNLGLGVPGIQIYMPLSDDLTLAFWCPTLMQEMNKAVLTSEAALAAARPVINPGVEAKAVELRSQLDRLETIVHRLRPFCEAFVRGVPVESKADNVEHLNSLQIRHAERFIMSKRADFSLAKRMIADDGSFKTGLRMSIG